MTNSSYPIGILGTPWGHTEKSEWRSRQGIQRSYLDEVLQRLRSLADRFTIHEYGQLDYPDGPYTLYGVTNRAWRSELPCILITGGVHGYETSGVQGALRFLSDAADDYLSAFNIVALPCISPWGYETINRWNPDTVDPNRSFVVDHPALEASLAMDWVRSLKVQFMAHFDLHETTDTDNSEFRPALGARNGTIEEEWDIPDGFYLVGDSAAPEPQFQAAIIESVSKVTHIAPADDSGRLIGIPLAQPGVINYQVASLGLCAGMTNARFRTTTEVYPDSARVDDENCVLAQIAAVRGGLDFILPGGFK